MSIEFDDLAFALVDSQAETAVLWVLSRYSRVEANIENDTARDGYLHASCSINNQPVFLGRVVYWMGQHGHITVSPEPLMLPRGVQSIEFRIVPAGQQEDVENTDVAFRLKIERNQRPQSDDVNAHVVVFSGPKQRPAEAIPPRSGDTTTDSFEEGAAKIAAHLSPSKFLTVELTGSRTYADSIERKLFESDPEGLQTSGTLIAIVMPKVDHGKGEKKERSVYPARTANLSPSRIREGCEQVRYNREIGLQLKAHPEQPRLEIRTSWGSAKEAGIDWRGMMVSLTLKPMPESRLSDLEASVRATVVERLVESAVQLDVQVQYARRILLGNLPQTTKGYRTRYGSGAYAKGRQIPFLCLWQGFLDVLNQQETEASFNASAVSRRELAEAQTNVIQECLSTWQRLTDAQMELGAASVPEELKNLVYVRKLVELTRREMYKNGGKLSEKFAKLTLWYANRAVEALATDTIGLEFGPLAMGTFDLMRIERVDGLIRAQRPQLRLFDPHQDSHTNLDAITEPVFTMGIDGLYVDLTQDLPDIRTAALLNQLIGGLINPSQAHKEPLAESEEQEKRQIDALGVVKPNEIITAGYVPARLGGNVEQVITAQSDTKTISQALRHATDYSAIRGNIAQSWQSIWVSNYDNHARSPENPLRWAASQAPGVNDHAPDIPYENSVHRLEGLLSGEIDQKLLAYWAEQGFPFDILDAQAADAHKAIDVPMIETSETEIERLLIDDITELFGELRHSNKPEDIYGNGFLSDNANATIVLNALAAFQKKDKGLIEAAFNEAKSAGLPVASLMKEVAQLRQEIETASKRIAEKLKDLPNWIGEIDDLGNIASDLPAVEFESPIIAEMVGGAVPEQASAAKHTSLLAQKIRLADFGKTRDSDDICHWLLTTSKDRSNDLQLATVAAMFQHLSEKQDKNKKQQSTLIHKSFVMASKILAAAAKRSGVTVSEDQANAVAAVLSQDADSKSKTEFWSGLRNEVVFK